MHRTVPVLLALLLLFPSCATIVSTARYTVPVRSEPSGARFTVTDRKGRLVRDGVTPAMVELKASSGYFSRGIYMVRLTMEDREPVSVELRARLNGWYWGNVVFGSVIGFLLVDPLSGAMYQLKNRMVHETLPFEAPYAR